jgi:Ca2+-transporting ATPase
VTAGLAIGVRRMAAAHALIRKLPAVETLGAASVICTDKTGTLTRNEMTVRKVFTADTVVDVSGSGYSPKGEFTIGAQPIGELPAPIVNDLEKTLRAGALANDANMQGDGERWSIQGDPTEGALVVAAHKYGLPEQALNTRFPRVGEVPFTSERKRHTTVHADAEHPDQLRVFVKGAPDVILELCDSIRQEDRVIRLTDERREQIMRENEKLASQALRTLAMAERALERREFGIGGEATLGEMRAALSQLSEQQIEHNLTFLGIAGMIDPPRAEARDAVQLARQAGVRTVMITGDHPGTAAAIARELGILGEDGRALRGAELSGLDDRALDEAVEHTDVYARVDPEHKLRIVESWQRQGRIVAMTGDGINDAPALRTANFGIARGITGTDVSKEAADMVLADDNFASIVRAIEEGRGIFDNIRKYLYYLLSCNAGEILTMFVGVLLGGVLGLMSADGLAIFLPLTAAQLLWINLITDGPPALALGLDPKGHDVMGRPPRQQRRGIISRRGWGMIFGIGAVMMVGTLFVLDGAYPGGLTDMLVRFPDDRALAERHARTLAFTTLVLFQLINVFNNRSPLESALVRPFENGLLWGAVALSLALQVAVVYVPFLQAAFATVALSAGDWLAAALVASTVLVVMEIGKFVARRTRPAS